MLDFFEFYISHIFRDGNQVADGMKNEAIVLQNNKIYKHRCKFLKKVQGAMMLDRAGLPLFRK